MLSLFNGIVLLRQRAAAIPPRHTIFLLAVALFFFSASIYAGTLSNDFVWDDVGVFVEDPSIRDFRNIPRFFYTPLVLGAVDQNQEVAGGERIRYYRPLLSTLHTLEYRCFGASPLGYKLVNLLFNSLVVVCAFLLVQTVTGRTGVAFLAALLYAAIPARGEAVYWAYSDSYILGAFFILLTLLAYHHRRRGLALFGMVAALLFQEAAILLPAVLAGYEGLIAGARREENWGLKRLAPFALLAVGYLGLRHLAAGAIPFSPLSFGDLILAGAFLSVKHLQIMFIPDAPVTMYRYIPGMFADTGAVGFGILLLAGALLLVCTPLWIFKKNLLFWYVWFFLWIATTFNVGSYANYLMAEKTLYLAALGPCVLLSLGACSLRRILRTGALVILLVMVGWHVGKIIERAPYWSNTTTYLEALLTFEPAYDVAHYHLAGLAMQSGQYDKAIEHLEKVLSLRPDLQAILNAPLADAHAERGRVLAEEKRLSESLTALQMALRYDPQRSATYNAIGIVYFLGGEPALAEKNWRMAVALDPRNAEALRNLQRFRLQGASSSQP